MRSLGLAVAVALWPCIAAADDFALTPSVAHRRYSPGGHFEVSGSVGVGVFTHLTQHTTLQISGAYNFWDWLAVELRVTYAFSGWTGVTGEVARRTVQRDPLSSLRITDDLSDLWEVRAATVLGVRYAPIYGKMSLLGDAVVRYQAYLWAGGGVGLFHRTSAIICNEVADRAAGTCANPFTETATKPLGSLAVGIRFFAGHHALKLELRNYLFPDSYRVDIDRVEAEAGRDTGRPASPAGLTSLFLLEAGYVFLF